MSGEPSQTSSLSIARYPNPACSYAIVDDEPVVLSTNTAFETQFGPGVEDEVVDEAFEALGLGVPDSASPLPTRLARGEQFRVRADATEGAHGEYLVQTVPPDGDDSNDGDDVGFLLFVELPADDTGDWTSGTLGIDHVASVVSHDLRNPLDVAKARLEAGRELDEEEHFEHVAQAHERMERIIQDVLTIARGEEVVEPDDTVDLTDVAQTAWETVETDGATLRIADCLPTAMADPDRVGRLFENLFRNAVEHGSTSNRTGPDDAVEHGSTSSQSSTDNGVAVTVGRLDEGSTDGFYVADDGPGIAPESRERVFEPGYSVDEHGTGLGLAIVARIVDLHGWSIEVTESATGGARFEVSGLDSG